MKVGVTGHHGFIGKNLVNFLKAVGHDVVTFNSDLRRRDLAYFFAYDSDYVVHLARKNKGPDDILLEDNIETTFRIALQCTLEKTPSVFISSTYPHKSAYKASNEIGESIVTATNINMGGKNSILSLPKVFGPHCKPHYNSFVSTLLYLIAKKEPYEHLINDIDEKIELIHVDRVCQQIQKMVESEDVNYISMDPELSLSFREIIKMAKSSNNVFSELVEWYSKNT